MGKRLAQRVRGWQLRRSPFRGLGGFAAVLFVIFLPNLAYAGYIAGLETLQQPLELTEFPHSVVLVTGSWPDGIDQSTTETSLVASIQTWNGVSCSFSELRYDGVVADWDNVPDGATPVGFVDPDEEPCFQVDTDIAYTVPCRESVKAVFLNSRDYVWRESPDPYQTVVEGEPLTVDVQSVITHELGHVLGIGHDDVTNTLATMRPRYLLDGGMSSLTADDKRALCALYEADGEDCASDADCGTFEVCTKLDGHGLCEPRRGELGDYCALDDLVCPGVCHVSSPATFSGYCTLECPGDDDCPDGYFCSSDSRRCLLASEEPEPSCTTAPTGGPLALLVGALFAWRRRRFHGS